MKHLPVLVMVVAGFCDTAWADGRWEALAPEFGVGTANCEDDGNIICATLMCEHATLTFGIMGTGHGGVEPPVTVVIEVDGVREQRRMTSRIVDEDFLHIRAPITATEPLVARLRSGRQLRITTFDPDYPFVYGLNGFSPEFDRVASQCR